MADKKISELDEIPSNEVDGNDYLPIVAFGATKRISLGAISPFAGVYYALSIVAGADGSLPTDLSPRGRPLTITGTLTSQNGTIVFDGSGGVHAPSDFRSYSDFGIRDFAVQAQFSTTTTTPYSSLIQKPGVASDGSPGSFIILINNGSADGRLAVYAPEYGSPIMIDSTGGWNDGQIHLVRWQRVDGVHSLFIDGQVLSTFTSTKGFTPALGGLNVGFDSYNAGREFVGTLNNIAVSVG